MYKVVIKRLLDIVISLISLPFFLVILLFVGPAIYLSDRGPIFYNAERLGYKCRTFKMYKFRSMKVNAPDIRNADGSTYNSEDDERITKIGAILRKTSIDEIPQIINVLKGDMSIIGPRPGLPEKWGYYSDLEKKRRSVRPGITGYSQAYFRNSDSMDERMINDIKYSDSVSLSLDIKILLKTISSVLRKKDIYRNWGMKWKKRDY